MTLPPPDPLFLIWGSAYVLLKWTLGAWAIRRVRAWWQS
jgi:hypothetical protein